MTSGKKRYTFIDQYRGWAVIFMIETHVLNAFLRQDLFSTSWYSIINFINGLVAPSFLFLAGYAFGIVATRKWNDFMDLNNVFKKQLSRYLLILLIAYALHMPKYSFRYLFTQLKWRENNVFWGVDILHSIGVSLIIMLLLVLVLRRQKLFFIFMGAAGAAISLLTPFIHSLPITTFFPAPFAGYFKRIYWSQFPLFPWMAFLFFGAFCSYLWQQAKKTNREHLFFMYGFIASAAVVPVMLFTGPMALRFNPVYPQFFFMKLAIVFMLLGCFHWWETKTNKQLPFATMLGQESLVAYTYHILFIYGAFWGWGKYPLAYAIGKTRTPVEIAGMTFFLIAFTTLLCFGWHKLKEKKPKLARQLHVGFWIAFFSFCVVFKP